MIPLEVIPLWCVVRQAVLVNLCLADGPALLLGIENLVCEVQLVLYAFDKLLQVLASVLPDQNQLEHSE